MGFSYRFWSLLFVFFLCTPNLAQPSHGLDFFLDGEWKFRPVPEQDLEAGKDERAKTLSAKDLKDSEWEPIKVPGFWDQPPGYWPWSSPKLSGGPHPNHDGEAWYRLRFVVPENRFPSPGDPSLFHCALRFQGVSAQASVWLNGTFVGRHLGAFGPFDLDISEALLRNEPNVLSIRVRDKTVWVKDNGQESGAPLAGIPLGFDPDLGGVPGSVSVRIAPKERIVEMAVHTDPRSATIDLLLSPEAVGNSSLTLEVIEKSSGKKVEIGQGKTLGTLPVVSHQMQVRLRDFGPETTPNPWSPESPNLYRLTAKVVNAKGALDVIETDFGFRSFEIRGGQFHLNGDPYFLLGAGSPPHYDRPSETLLRSHLGFLKEAGVRIVRFAHEPPDEKWLSVCDEIGLLAWVEGALYAEGNAYDFTDNELIATASGEMIQLARSFRNHPSMAIWSIGSGNSRSSPNEKARENVERGLNSIAKEVAQLDHDSIVLPESDSRGLIQSPVEDWQSGMGWYRGKDEDWAPFLRVTSSRLNGATSPWVCSALETGYSSAGQGRIIPDPYEEAASRMRIGQSGEDRNRLLFTQAARIKRLIEVTRAQRNPEKNRIAGVFPFNCANWFFYPLTEGEIRPKPLLASIRQAFRPVILALDLPKQNYYSGELLETTVTVVNDTPDQKILKGANLILEAFVGTDELNSQTQRENLEIKPNSSTPFSMVVVLPEEIPGLRRATIRVRLFLGEEEYASNEAEILIAPSAWSRPKSEKPFEHVLVYDPKASLQPYLEKYSLQTQPFSSFDQLEDAVGLVIGSGGFDDYLNRAWPILLRWLEGGGKMAVLDQPLGSDRWAFSGPFPPGYRVAPPEAWPTGIDRVDVVMEGHPLFEDIRAEALEDWGRDRVVAKHFLARTRPEPPYGHQNLVHAVVREGSLEWGDIVVEDRYSEGAILYSQLELASKSTVDPVSSKILSNLIDWAGDSLTPIFLEIEEGSPPFLAPLVGNSQNEITAPSAGTAENEPIRALLAPDGPFEATQCCGIDPETKTGVIPLPHEFGQERRVYYDIDDRFWLDTTGKAEVKVLVNAISPSKIRLDYDSSDKTVEHLGHYKQSNVVDILEVGIWKEVVLSAPQARFGNRQKNGADFRLTTVMGEVIYGPISVKRIE